MAATLSTQLLPVAASPTASGICSAENQLSSQSSSCPSPTSSKLSPITKEVTTNMNTSMVTSSTSGQQSLQCTQSSQSSSITSLFERVTNFRRSLIKSNQHKKNKSRGQSASFNLFATSHQGKSYPSINNDENGVINSNNSVDHHLDTNVTSSITMKSSSSSCPLSITVTSATTTTTSTITPSTSTTTDIINKMIKMNKKNGSSSNSGQKDCAINKQGQADETVMGTPTLIHDMIHVDEEDAIYGFTSLNLNNPSRRQLLSLKTSSASSNATISSTQVILSSSSSSSASSTLSNVMRQHQQQMIFSSSSCISLYETIEECENGTIESSDKLTPVISQKLFPPKLTATSLYQQTHSAKMYSTPNTIVDQSNDWKHPRSRRLSATTLNASNNHQSQSELSDLSLVKQYQRQSSHPPSSGKLSTLITPNTTNYHNYSSPLAVLGQARSSDDILMMSNNNVNQKNNIASNRNTEHVVHSHSINNNQKRKYSDVGVVLTEHSSSSSSTSRIYENLVGSSRNNLNGVNGNYRIKTSSLNNQNVNVHHNRHHSSSHSYLYYPDPRKLTKDSGYESSSTLVSLGTPTMSNVQNTLMISNSSGYGVLNNNNLHQHNHQNQNHSRSDSIDSNLSHKSYDSPPFIQNSIPLADSEDDEPEGVQSDLQDSPPPTPPIRYSSLPEHYRKSNSKILNDDGVYEEQPVEYDFPLSLAPRMLSAHAPIEQVSVMQTNNIHSIVNNTLAFWPYNLYPKMHRKQQQQHKLHQYMDITHENQHAPTSHHCSMPTGNPHHSAQPSMTTPTRQIVRSQRVQQVQKQDPPTLIKSVVPNTGARECSRSSSSSTSSLSPPPPPVLLPKTNPCTPHQHYDRQSIKEIQKRAVYEFYLRQTEKNKKNLQQNNNNKINQSASSIANMKSSNSSTNQVHYKTDNKENFSQNLTNKLESSAYLITTHNYADNKPISSNQYESSLVHSRSSPEFVQLNNTIKMSEPNESLNVLETFPPPPSPSTKLVDELNTYPSHQSSFELLLNILDQSYLDLMKFWPKVDFTSLLPMLLLVFGDTSEDSSEEDEEGDRKLEIESKQLVLADEGDHQEEPTIQQELLRIDRARRWQHRLMSRRNLLQMELARIEQQLKLTEQVGEFIRNRLQRFDPALPNTGHRDKFDLLCADLRKVIGLIFSIHKQINECRRTKKQLSNEQQLRSNLVEVDEQQTTKHDRLLKQLDEAKQLRDAIQQRSTMFIDRCRRRFDITLNNHHIKHDNQEDQSYAHCKTQIAQNDQDKFQDHEQNKTNDEENLMSILFLVKNGSVDCNVSDSAGASSFGHNQQQDNIIKKNGIKLCDTHQQQRQRLLPLSNIIRWYLEHLEMFIIQQCLIEYIMNEQRLLMALDDNHVQT